MRREKKNKPGPIVITSKLSPATLAVAQLEKLAYLHCASTGEELGLEDIMRRGKAMFDDPEFDLDRLMADSESILRVAPEKRFARLIDCGIAAAMKTFYVELTGDIDEAWRYAVRSMRLTEWMFHSYESGQFFEKEVPILPSETGGTKLALTILARLGADARHEENRSMKAQAIEYYRANIDALGSKDNAATEIAGRIVPVKFRTVRNWLKNLPSAGRT